MNEKEILITMLSLLITSLILTILFNYNVKIQWDKKLERWCIYYEILKNDWDTITGRWTKLELKIIPLPLWLNKIFKSNE